MPQPPTCSKMLKQVQKMQADMMAAQEQLKDEIVEASAGGGMVKVEITGDLERQGDHDRPRRGRPRGRRAAPGHGARRRQRGAARRRRSSAADARWAALDRRARRPRAAGSAASGLPGALGSELAAPPPVQRLVTELGKLPGHRQPHRAAARVPHPARARRRTRSRSPTRSARSRSRSASARSASTSPRARAARSAQDERRDPTLICVVEEPGDVIPIERTHEYRGRYHVLGGALSPIDGVDPEDLKIAELYARVRRAGEP